MIRSRLRTIDCGKTCGIYLISLGALSVFSMLFRGISLHSLELDLSSLLFFWAGYYLIKHNNIARKWVIGFSVFFVIVVFLIAIFILVAGMGHVQVKFPFYHSQEPSLIVTYIAVLGVLLFALIPIALLYNDKARQEFKEKCT